MAVGDIISRTVADKAVKCEETFSWFNRAAFVQVGSRCEIPCQDRIKSVFKSLTFINEEETDRWCVSAKAFDARVP